MRWLGLAKAGLQVRLSAIAYNLRRTITMLQGAAALRGTSLSGVARNALIEGKIGAHAGAHTAQASALPSHLLVLVRWASSGTSAHSSPDLNICNYFVAVLLMAFEGSKPWRYR